ncbi:MAG: glycoside hydrolase family 3 [Ignavibacteriales bacterium]|nr:glycoside hydrolase family 3 [Ignavibacteriales bacterium]
MTLEDKLGQLVLIGFRDATLKDDNPIVEDLREGRVGGVYLSDKDLALRQDIRNIESPTQLRRLVDQIQSYAKYPVFVGIDQEGYGVNRLRAATGWEDFFADCPDPLASRPCAERTARALREAGVNIVFAPCLDLNVNPENPVIGKRGRSVSADPYTVTAWGRLYARALKAEGLLTCGKHFPGHGSSSVDTHLDFADVTDTWSERELEPYRALFEERLLDSAMTCHVTHRAFDPELPGTLSRSIIDGLLRERLGFRGVVFSDDLHMKAISDRYSFDETVALAFAAGVDVILFANNMPYVPDVATRVREAFLKALDKGATTEARVEEAYARVTALKRKGGLLA